MIVKNSELLFCDVDDTLIKWEGTGSGTNVRIKCSGHSNLFSVHTEHIKQLQEHIKRGHGVVIWSQGGWEWASAVVDGLVEGGLLSAEEVEDFVIMNKPRWVYDDLQAEAWMPESRFIEIEGWGRE